MVYEKTNGQNGINLPNLDIIERNVFLPNHVGLINIKHLIPLASLSLIGLLSFGLNSAKGLVNHAGVSNSPNQPTSSSLHATSVVNPIVASSPSQNNQSTSATSGGATVNVTGSGTAKVVVNGQTIQVPDNGSVQKTIQSNDGTTTVNVNVQNSNNGSTSGSSSYHSTSVSTSSSSTIGSTNTTTEFHSEN